MIKAQVNNTTSDNTRKNAITLLYFFPCAPSISLFSLFPFFSRETSSRAVLLLCLPASRWGNSTNAHHDDDDGLVVYTRGEERVETAGASRNGWRDETVSSRREEEEEEDDDDSVDVGSSYITTTPLESEQRAPSRSRTGRTRRKLVRLEETDNGGGLPRRPRR